jgi:hypothetical protein
VALFSRVDRTFNLELVRAGDVVIEELHTGGAEPRRDRFADDDAALAAFRRRVVELVDEGWRLSLADADLDHPVATDPELEARIASASDAERTGLLAVYADWLGERGDPCGELAALRARDERGHTPELGAAIQRVELARELELFGLLTRLPNHRDSAAMLWRDGWIDGYDFVTTSGTLAMFALLAPMARFVRALVFRQQHTVEVRSAIAVWPRRAQLRRLVVPHTGYAQELLDVLPGLDDLTMHVGNRVRGHATVRRLVLYGNNAPRSKLAGEWPAVREVVLRYRGKRPEVDDVLAEASLPAHPVVTVEAQ